MKVLVSGDRNWKDRDYLFAILDDIHALYGISGVIEGCARGADRLTGWPCPVDLKKGEPTPLPGWATERGIPCDHNPAPWHILRNAAGPVRNISMLRKGPDMVVAFHPNIRDSKGTRHMVEIAREAGVPVHIFPHRNVNIDKVMREAYR